MTVVSEAGGGKEIGNLDALGDWAQTPSGVDVQQNIESDAEQRGESHSLHKERTPVPEGSRHASTNLRINDKSRENYQEQNNDLHTRRSIEIMDMRNATKHQSSKNDK